MKLTIELVPSTCWYSNVRSQVSRREWDIIRKQVYDAAEHKCEICGCAPKSLECHEVWNYDDAQHIQKLIKMIALCKKCHQVKHFGLARVKGKEKEALKHFAKVNEVSIEDANLYIEVQFEIWSKRSCHKWTLDISTLDSYKETNK